MKKPRIAGLFLVRGSEEKPRASDPVSAL